MIERKLLDSIIDTLENMADKLYLSCPVVKIDYTKSNIEEEQLKKIKNIATLITTKFQNKINKATISENILSQNSPNAIYKLKKEAFSLSQIDLILTSISDELKLAVLTEFFDRLAHISYSEIANLSYNQKDNLLDHILNNFHTNGKAIALPSKGTQNANVSVIFNIGEEYLSWHSKNTEFLNYPPNKLTSQIAFFLLHQTKKIQHKTEEELLTEFYNDIDNGLIDDSTIRSLLDGNYEKSSNFTRINRIAEKEASKSPTQSQPLPNIEYVGGGVYATDTEKISPHSEKTVDVELATDTLEQDSQKSDEIPVASTTNISTQENTLDSVAHEHSDTATIHSENITVGPRNSSELFSVITDSPNETIKSLLELLKTKKSCYGFNLSQIVKMEIFQYAFMNGIITEKELEEQQLSILPELIESANEKKRVEIKSCGKDNEIKENWEAGQKKLILRISPQLAAKPIIWPLSDELTELLLEEYPEKITKTNGRVFNQQDNLQLLQKIISKETQHIELEDSKTSEPVQEEKLPSSIANVIQCSVNIFDELLESKEFSERLLKSVRENFSPGQKAAFLAILLDADPDCFNLSNTHSSHSISKNTTSTNRSVKDLHTSDRNGGPSHD